MGHQALHVTEGDMPELPVYVQVAELEAQAAAEPVLVGEKEAASQSVEQLEARVQTKDQVSQGQALGSCPHPCVLGNPGPF